MKKIGRACQECYEMAAGKPKSTDKRIVIATWAMLLRSEPEFFEQFDLFICDEAHQADSKALGRIIMNLSSTAFRYGFTGTLDGSKSHEMQCRAWFGSLIRSKTTRELIDEGVLSPMEVRCISLEYSAEERRAVKKLDYQKEIKYLVEHKARNDWLLHFALTRDKNTILLFNFVGKHGELLYKEAKEKAEEYGKQVYYIVGSVGVEERENIRKIMEENDNVIVFASFGTMSIGVNIKNVHYLILAHPFKARIRTLQSIGRLLRKLTVATFDNPKKAVIIDVIDDLCIGKHKNRTFNHGIQRMSIYESECFDMTYEKKKL